MSVVHVCPRCTLPPAHCYCAQIAYSQANALRGNRDAKPARAVRAGDDVAWAGRTEGIRLKGRVSKLDFRHGHLVISFGDGDCEVQDFAHLYRHQDGASIDTGATLGEMGLRAKAVVDGTEAAIDAATPTGMTPKTRNWAGQAVEKRIAELEALVAQREKEWREQFEFSTTENQRACKLADEAGALRTEMQEVKAENSDLRREVERLKRKAGAR